MDVVEVVQRLGGTSQGMVPVSTLIAEGVSRAALSRAKKAGAVFRVAPSVYAVAPLPVRPKHAVTHEGVAPEYVAHVRAALLSLGPKAAACGVTAAVLFGWPVLVEPTVVHVALAHGRTIKRRPGVRARQRRTLTRSRLRVVQDTDRLLATSSVQTALDCAAELPLLQGVAVCDSALRSGRVTLEQLTSGAARLPGSPDAETIRRVLSLCDPRSGSVLESVLRVQMCTAGIGGFTTQAVLQPLPELRVDFCFPLERLVVEVDGSQWHQDPRVDRARDNTLATLGWRVLRFTWAQVVHESEATLGDICAALRATASIHLVTPAAQAVA